MARKATAKAAKWVEVQCAFCRGTGRDPFGVLSVLSNCPTCGGKGTVRVKEPYETCSVCRGTGIYYRSRLSCGTCGGKGVVHVEEPY